jgi:hypothetical protein
MHMQFGAAPNSDRAGKRDIANGGNEFAVSHQIARRFDGESGINMVQHQIRQRPAVMVKPHGMIVLEL